MELGDARNRASGCGRSGIKRAWETRTPTIVFPVPNYCLFLYTRWQPMFYSWYRWLAKNFVTSTKIRWPKRFRPTVEILESREVPANITVDTALDNNVRDKFLSFREALLISNAQLDVGVLTADEKVQIDGNPATDKMNTIKFQLALVGG